MHSSRCLCLPGSGPASTTLKPPTSAPQAPALHSIHQSTLRPQQPFHGVYTATRQWATLARCQHSQTTTTTTTTSTTTTDVTSASTHPHPAGAPAPPPSTSPSDPGAGPSVPNLKQRTYDLCLALGITQSTAFRLANSHPDAPTHKLATETTAMARQLGLPLEELCLLASKEPGILNAPADLGQTVIILGDLLGGLTPTELSRAIIRTPFLLSVPPEVLLEQFESLQEQLGVDRQLLSRLVYQQPYVLNTPVITITGRISKIASLLRLSTPQSVQLLSAYPPLAVESADKLRRRLDELCVVLGADVQQVLDMVALFPPILLIHPEITTARLQMLSDNLDVPMLALMPLVLKNPSMFSTPQNILVDQFNKLFLYFGQGRTKTDVLALIADNPAVLGLTQPGVPISTNGQGPSQA